MAAVLECQMDIIIILLMGGGTSMLAIVPSLLEVNRTTVFILPLNSLTMDYERRLFEMNITHQVYKPDIELNLRDNLVIISAGKLQMASWHTALANLAHRGPLACIVMDEAHIPLVAKDYHKSVKHMCDIQSEPVLLVLLSTTLPPSLMSYVSATYLLLSNMVTFRKSINRPELKYMLEKTDPPPVCHTDHASTTTDLDRARPRSHLCAIHGNMHGVCSQLRMAFLRGPQ